MTIQKENNSFMEYFDFLEIAQEILKKAPKELFNKMIYLIINKFRNKEIELEKLSLDIDKMSSMPFDDLDEFYDSILDEIENVTLFKKKIELLKDKEPMFNELYNQTDRLLSSLINYMDRVGQLEVRILKDKEISA